MDKIIALLKTLGFELSADRQKQVKEVIEKEFVSVDVTKEQKAKLESRPHSFPQKNSSHKAWEESLF